MSFVPRFNGRIEKGKVVLENTDMYRHYLMAFLEGEEVTVAVTRKRRGNSRRQQNYYRGVVVYYLARQIGESLERMHQILQAKFFTYLTDDGYPYVRSTEVGEWETWEWEEKMTEIRMWAQDFFSSPENPYGLIIPLPNEVDEDGRLL